MTTKDKKIGRTRPEADTGWADQLLVRLPLNATHVSMGNKTARAAWAPLRQPHDYTAV